MLIQGLLFLGGVAGGIKKPFCHSSFSSGTKLGGKLLWHTIVVICRDIGTKYLCI